MTRDYFPYLDMGPIDPIDFGAPVAPTSDPVADAAWWREHLSHLAPRVAEDFDCSPDALQDGARGRYFDDSRMADELRDRGVERDE